MTDNADRDREKCRNDSLFSARQEIDRLRARVSELEAKVPKDGQFIAEWKTCYECGGKGLVSIAVGMKESMGFKCCHCKGTGFVPERVG